MTEPTVTLAMIVKNESSHLGACLESAKNLVDEIIIVDTGSTDNTVEVAYNYTDKIYHYVWQNDFSAARNYAISQASGDWILYLDADETLVCQAAGIKDLIARNQDIEAYMIPIEQPFNESTGEMNHFIVLRLFRNSSEYYFTGSIHEQVVVSKRNVVGFAEGIKIKHTAVSPRERNRKRGRNLNSLKIELRKQPDNFFLNYYLGVEWLGLGRPKLALPFLEKGYHNLTDEHILFKSASLRYLLICLITLKEFDRVICLGQEAALRYPDFSDIYYLTGCALEEKGEFKLAIKWFNQAIACGVPPVLYSHMQGVESFLAYYHLGYCYENIKQMKNAENCYEQSLVKNNQYYYPCCGLFLIKVARCGLIDTFQYFSDKKYFANPRITFTVADLFYKMRYPGYARRCLLELPGSYQPTDELLHNLGKYYILSGRIAEGLEYLKQVPNNSAYQQEALILMALGLLLTGKYTEVKSLALKAWPQRELRIVSQLICRLSCWLKEEKESGKIFNWQRDELTGYALTILDFCHHFLSDVPPESNSQLVTIIEILQKVLGNSAKGSQILNLYCEERIADIRQFLNYKF